MSGFAARSNLSEYGWSALEGAVTSTSTFMNPFLGVLSVGVFSATEDLRANGTVDWGGVAFDVTTHLGVGSVLDRFPAVRGRWPKLFSRAFFVGQHATRAWLEEAISASVAFDREILRYLLPSQSWWFENFIPSNAPTGAVSK